MFESKLRALIFLFISVLLALGAAVLFADYIDKTKASLGDMVTIHVARSDIPAGTPITPDMLEPKEIPKKYNLPSYVAAWEEIKNQSSVVSIKKGDLITKSMLKNNTLITGNLRQVMLRAPLAVFDETIQVFDKVDLVVSYEVQGDVPVSQSGALAPGKGEKRVTEVVLRNVTVSQVVPGERTGTHAAIGVALSLEDSKTAIWALNYGKELRVLKSNAGGEDTAGGTTPTESPKPSASPKAGASPAVSPAASPAAASTPPAASPSTAAPAG